jgi:1-deoxy-D-xylulose-5-phosphate reductoisomerase
MKKINVVIFGATGSIGKSTISFISKHLDTFKIEGITCNSNLGKLYKIAKLYNVKKIGFNEKKIKLFKKYNLKQFEVFNDISDFSNIISNKTEVIVFANSGLSSLDLLLKILKSGKKVGIANKECIISLGSNFNKLSKKYSTEVVPLDSEHNSIYHLLNKGFGRYKSITITASGGPFMNLTLQQLKKVTLKQAINHPVWSMGKKISIDSATMMNKALEIIEAKFLFNLKDNEISAIIHPQALVHAIVNYENGISTAILNKPDMRIPISTLFFEFDKYCNYDNGYNLLNYPKLEFIPIDQRKFPSIRLGANVMKMGGLAPHVFNYLNEYLVNLFLKGKIKFNDIVKFNEINLELIFAKNKNITSPKPIDINNINNWIDNNIYLGN